MARSEHKTGGSFLLLKAQSESSELASFEFKRMKRMLYLTRREGQSFYMALSAEIDPEMKVKDLLQEPIQILINEFHGGICKIGIDAPRAFNVAREEVYDEGRSLQVEIKDVSES